MSNILAFPAKDKDDALDDVTMCTLEINGKGDVDLIVNAENIETAEQHNWLIAKIGEAISRLIDRKNEIIG